MIIGIDLGTTNSLVAVWRDGRSQLVPNALGRFLTPSCVGMDDDGSVLVGEAARARLQTHPAMTAALFKRYMGSERITQLGKQRLRPEELSSMVLRSLKADAEAFLGAPVTEAIITVPAYFSDAQRKATRAAGQLAGLKVERLLNEPTAAALAYGIQDMGRDTRFLVFDLGGGTFDVSILELFEGVMEVRATAGDNALGGEDFVSTLADAFRNRSGMNKALLGKELDARDLQRLRDEAERVKRALSETPTARMALRTGEQEFGWDLDEDAFAALAEPLMQRLRAPVERALRDATIKASDLDAVVLAGGATRMPLVRRMVSRMFGRFPTIHLDPDHAIALGAAVQAGLKMRDAALDEVVMTDVAPYSLGIAISRQVGLNQHTGGHFMPIIERNTTVPVSRVENVATISDFQRALEVKVYQGESRMVSDNIYLGSLSFPIPPKKAGEVNADVRFTYDVSGVLEAEITVYPGGETHKLVVTENAGVMTPAEVEARLTELAALKIHPRDKIENRTVLARADRLYEVLLGAPREFLAQHIAAFQAVLAQQDDAAAVRARALLEAAMAELDAGGWL
ncbi:MAG: molecular chaperone HscC [Massilia sp.]